MLTLKFDAANTFLLNVPDEVEDRINAELMWYDRSVEYQNNINRHRGFKPKDARRYCYNSKNKSFPTGLIPRVCTLLDSLDVPYELERLYEGITPNDVDLPAHAWKHQRDIIDTLLSNYRGLAGSPTASGKSTSISFIINKFLDKNVLIVVPKITLVRNVAQDIEKVCGIEVGRIGGGKEEWKNITVSTAKSLSLYADSKYKDILQDMDVLIFDEVHNYSNKTGEIISNACPNTTYRFGLSATLNLENGSELVLEGIVGPKVIVVPDPVMVDLDVIHRPEMYFIQVPSPKLKLDIPKGMDKPPRDDVYTQGLVEYKLRNNLVVEVLKTFLEQEKRGCALILVERCNHGHMLVDLCKKEDIDIEFIWGNTPAEHRFEVLDKFKSGELKCLIASSILNEGEDLPLLELVINAGGGSGERGIVQKVGRGLRKDKTETKLRALIVDFYDLEEYYLEANSHKRMLNINKRHPGCASIVNLDEVLERIKDDS